MFSQSYNVFWSTGSFLFLSQMLDQESTRSGCDMLNNTSAIIKPENMYIGCWLIQLGICMFIKVIVSLLNCIFIEINHDVNSKW